jgi:hypothetical protein
MGSASVRSVSFKCSVNNWNSRIWSSDSSHVSYEVTVFLEKYVCFNYEANCCDYEYIVLVINEYMSMEYSWNDTDRGKLMYLEKNLSQYHFVHHKFHIDGLALNQGHHSWSLTTGCVSHGTAWRISYPNINS